MIVIKIKSTNRVGLQPLETGQVWRMADSNLQVGLVRKLLVHYKLSKPNAVIITNSVSGIATVEKYLKKYISPFIDLKAVNPQFEEVMVRFNVKLTENNPGENFCKRTLMQNLMQFLSPWAFDSSKDIGFGGEIFKSALINFIEEQQYVDFVTDFICVDNVLPVGIGRGRFRCFPSSCLLLATPNKCGTCNNHQGEKALSQFCLHVN